MNLQLAQMSAQQQMQAINCTFVLMFVKFYTKFWLKKIGFLMILGCLLANLRRLLTPKI
jgi:hypothetical protein